MFKIKHINDTFLIFYPIFLFGGGLTYMNKVYSSEKVVRKSINNFLINIYIYNNLGGKTRSKIKLPIFYYGFGAQKVILINFLSCMHCMWYILIWI